MADIPPPEGLGIPLEDLEALAAEWPHLAEVVRRLAGRQIVPGAVFYAMALELRGTAGTIAGVWNTRFIIEIYGSLQDAIANGRTVRDWVVEAQKILDKFGSAEGVTIYSGDRWSAWYADLVFRQNVQSAYAAGRLVEQYRPSEILRSPYLMFSAIRDGRNDSPAKCPGMICRTLDGLVIHKMDPEARKFLAPRHFNCRCHEIELDEIDVLAGGYLLTTGDSLRARGLVPPEGWDTDRVAQLAPDALKRGLSAP